MNIQQTQKHELAGKTKLTAVSVHLSPSKKVTKFVMLMHDSNGKAILPMSYLNEILRGIPRGVTYTVG